MTIKDKGNITKSMGKFIVDYHLYILLPVLFVLGMISVLLLIKYGVISYSDFGVMNLK